MAALIILDLSSCVQNAEKIIIKTNLEVVRTKNVWGNGVLDEIAVLIIGIGSIVLTAMGRFTTEQCVYIWGILLAYIFGRGREITKKNGGVIATLKKNNGDNGNGGH